MSLKIMNGANIFLLYVKTSIYVIYALKNGISRLELLVFLE